VFCKVFLYDAGIKRTVFKLLLADNIANSASPKSLISKRYLLISISLSLGTLAFIIWYTYTPGVLTHLAPKRFPGLVIALVVSFLRVWFLAARFRFLANEELSWAAGFRTILAWDFTSAVTPSTIGGAPMATYAMTKEGLSLGESSAIILYTILLDQIWYATAIPILLIAGIYYEVVPPEIGFVGDVSMALLYIGLLSYAGFLAYGMLVNPSAIKKIVRAIFKLPLLRRWSDKIYHETEKLEEYAQIMSKKPPKFFLKGYLLTATSWMMRALLPTIVILSLLPAPEILSFLRSMAMNLAFLVIPTPGGSGGVEGLFVLFQGPLIDRVAFVGLAVFLWRIISYYISIGFGMAVTTWYFNTSVLSSNTEEKA